MPLFEVDSGTIPDIEHLATLWNTLAQRGDVLALERVHVMFALASGILLGQGHRMERMRA